MQQSEISESESYLLQSTKYFPSRWLKKPGIRIKGKEKSGDGVLKNYYKRHIRSGICVTCSLYSLAAYVEFELSNAVTINATKDNPDILRKLSPGYWETMGFLLGCLISGIGLCYLGRRTSLQRLALPVLLISYIFTLFCVIIGSSSPYFISTTILQIFTQNISKSLTVIVLPIYILETICWHPGSYKSKAIATLLSLTQLPPAVAKVLRHSEFVKIFNVYFLMLIPVSLLTYALIMLMYSPESPRWLLQIKNNESKALKTMKALWSHDPVKYNVNKEIETMQKEMQGVITICTPNSYVRPLMVSTCFLLLVQLVGYEAFHFYTNWCYKLAGITTVDSNFVVAAIRLTTISFTTLLTYSFPGPKCTSIVLLISTPIIMVCLLVTGISMYALEQGSIRSDQLAVLPITLLLTYETAFWCGIGVLAIPVCTTIMPAKSRPIVLTIGLIIYQITLYFCDIFLPLMINVLHPYGVFWFHSLLSGIVLMFISFVIIPELKWMATYINNEETTKFVL